MVLGDGKNKTGLEFGKVFHGWAQLDFDWHTTHFFGHIVQVGSTRHTPQQVSEHYSPSPPTQKNCRELGRRPSQQQEKVALYVKKPSAAPEEDEEDSSKTKRFMDKMSKKSVDADFLNTIQEEKQQQQPKEEAKKPFQAKKFPFNR